MTDMELAYRKAEIVKTAKQNDFYIRGFATNTNRIPLAFELELALVDDLCSTTGMTREVAWQIVMK